MFSFASRMPLRLRSAPYSMSVVTFITSLSSSMVSKGAFLQEYGGFNIPYSNSAPPAFVALAAELLQLRMEAAASGVIYGRASNISSVAVLRFSL